MAQCIGTAEWAEAHLLPLCACGIPAEDDDPRCADCITDAEREAEEAAADRGWGLPGYAA
jgi:hypothetical protein